MGILRSVSYGNGFPRSRRDIFVLAELDPIFIKRQWLTALIFACALVEVQNFASFFIFKHRPVISVVVLHGINFLHEVPEKRDKFGVVDRAIVVTICLGDNVSTFFITQIQPEGL